MTTPHPARVEDPRAGLTLVEMIVALGLSALLVGFLAEGSRLIRSFGRIGAAVSAQDETLAVRDHLRQTIAAALGGGSGLQRNGFAGVGDTAVFTVPGDGLLESGAPVRITLAALPDGGRMTLLETRAPLNGGDERPDQRTRRLVEGAVRVNFSYLGALQADAVARWDSEWTDPDASPRLIRIDVAFPAGDARRWPPFLVLMPSSRSPAGEGSKAPP